MRWVWTRRGRGRVIQEPGARVQESSSGGAVARPPQPHRRIAVFAIHGVSPIQRYAFQDQFAEALKAALNAAKATNAKTWVTAPYWPWVDPGANTTSQTVRARALRLYGETDDPENPAGGFIDVHEGYWSPLSKNKTNAASLVQWLFSCLFLAASATAGIPARAAKLRWDLQYVFGALAIACVLLVGALATGTWAFQLYAAAILKSMSAAGQTPPAVLKNGTFASTLVASPLALLTALPWWSYVELVLFAVTAYAAFELYVVARSSRDVADDAAALRGAAGGHLIRRVISARTWHRWAKMALTLFVIALVLISIAVGVVLARYFSVDALALTVFGVTAVAAAGLLRGARLLLDFIIENVLGDVQVYTTHDTNAAFYEVREAIIATVADALLSVIRAQTQGGKPLYDRIHIAGHSLGSTVGLDVIIRLRQLALERGIDITSDFLRIRSFVTFGTALEKTRFLFDVRQPTPSAAYDQFDNDLYGELFSANIASLRMQCADQGIFWRNVWYERDVVANGIVTYKSDVNPLAGPANWRATTGQPERTICDDVALPSVWPKYAFIHGNYTGDVRFWNEVVPILTTDTTI